MAEKEYIDKVAFNYAIREAVKRYPNSFYNGLEVARQIAHDFPAADVRPVVMCKDCDCWNEWDSAGKESLGNYVCSCAHWSVEDGPILYTSPTDFCSYGEKREES